MIGNAAKAAIDRTLAIAPRDWISAGRKAWVTPYAPNRLTARVLFERGTIAQVVVPRDTGVVDQDVERCDALDGFLNRAESVTSRVTGTTR
jgi:hypothetical protein